MSSGPRRQSRPERVRFVAVGVLLLVRRAIRGVLRLSASLCDELV
jgi:hypothetical protein